MGKRVLLRKCGHTKYQVRKDFSRTCNICSDTESPTTGTLFHKLKFGLLKAFYICFEMSTTTKSLSASQVAHRYDISRQTAHYFMHKVREAMKSSESHKMNDKRNAGNRIGFFICSMLIMF